MPQQSWWQTLYSTPVAGAAVTAAGPTSILPTNDPGWTFPASFFGEPGQQLLIKGAGQLTNIATTPGTLTLNVLFGATIVYTSGAMQMSTTAHTSLPIWYEILLTLRIIGTVAQFMGQGVIHGQPLSLTAVADSTTTVATLMMPNTAPALGTAFSSKASQAFDHSLAFSIGGTGNSFTLQQLTLASLN